MAVERVTIEVWNKAKKPIADISALAKNRRMTLRRNGIGSFDFDVDLLSLEVFAREKNLHPRLVLWPLQLDIIVKLNDVPYEGFRIVAATPMASEEDASLTLQVRCLGFLSLLNKRYITKSYSATESIAIAVDMINTTQAKARGDMGITIASSQYSTGILRDRTYERSNAKDAVVNLTQLETGPFDLRIDPFKEFKTFAQLGALRRDTPLIYGDGGNIESFDLPTEGSSVANEITGLGSGFGADQITAVAEDIESQAAYDLLEELPQWNSIINPVELLDNAKGYLAASKDILQIPRVTVTNKVLTISTTSVGDRFPVDLRRNSTLATFTDNINGQLFRTEEMTVSWEDTDAAFITLTFDSQGVNQNEA